MTQPVVQNDQPMSLWQALAAAEADEVQASQDPQRLGIPVIGHLQKVAQQFRRELTRQAVYEANGFEGGSQFRKFLSALEVQVRALEVGAKTVLGWQRKSQGRSARVAALADPNSSDQHKTNKSDSNSPSLSVWKALSAVMADRTHGQRESVAAAQQVIGRMQALSVQADTQVVSLLKDVAQLQQEIQKLGTELSQGFLGELFRLLAGRADIRAYAAANRSAVNGSVPLSGIGAPGERASVTAILAAAGLGAQPGAGLQEAFLLLRSSPEFGQLRVGIRNLHAIGKKIAAHEALVSALEKSARELLAQVKEAATIHAREAHPARGGSTHV